MSQLVTDIEAKAAEMRRAFSRLALAPMLVRVVIAVAASGSVFLTFPKTPAMQLAILLPVLFPRTLMVSGFILVTLVLWLLSSGVEPGMISVWRVTAIAIALYVVHVGSALAAVLPSDAVLTPGVFRPWILRAVLVSVLTATVGGFIFSLQKIVSAGSETVVATIGGFVLLVTTAIFLAYLGNRRQ